MTPQIAAKRLLFVLALIFIIWFGLIPLISDELLTLIMAILAGLKIGDICMAFSRKVFTDELDKN